MASRAKARVRYTIDELCEIYLNEDVHTEHVARLALELFDAVRRWTGMTRYDRRLLEAAARLHDVGYALDPRHHMQKSIEIVKQDGLEGFQDKQVPYLLVAIALHQNSIPQRLYKTLVDDLPDPERGLRIAAFLRVADGLDQSHIQDASIHGVRKSGKAISVAVRSPISPDNLVRADSKASLWREVFPWDIRFEAEAAPEARTFRLLRGGENRYEALRRVAYVQYKIIRANEEGPKTGDDPEPLHDLRVALRRFRSLLTLFRKPLKDTWAGDIDRRLAAVAKALGPARDYDVWMERLREMEAQQDLSRSRVWNRYLAHQKEFAESHVTHVRQVLDGARYRNLMQEIAYFLRIQLSELVKESKGNPVEPYVARRLWRLSRRIVASEIPGGSWEVEDFHALRKQCRRGRYIAESFGSVLGTRTRRWGKTLKRMADVLGDLHDADVGLERVAYEAVAAPRVLVAALKAQRATALREVDAAWAELKDERAFQKLKRELKKDDGVSLLEGERAGDSVKKLYENG